MAKKTNKKNLILDAVLKRIYAKHDLNSVKIADIAKEADIGKGTIYEYFNSKEELIVEAVFYGMNIMFDSFDILISDNTIDFIKKTDLILEFIFSITEKNNYAYDFITILSGIEFKDQEQKENFFKRLCSFENKYFEIFKKFMSFGQEEGFISKDLTDLDIVAARECLLGSTVKIINMQKSNYKFKKEDVIKTIKRNFLLVSNN